MHSTCLLLLLIAIPSTSTEISEIKTLNEFISETRNTWNSRRKKYNDTTFWSKLPPTRYNLTDSLTINNHAIQLRGFGVVDRGSILQHNTFLFHIHYEGRRIDCPHATITSIKSDSSLSGTEVMLLIHYILEGIGVKTCSLKNRARFAYRHYLHRHLSTVILNSMPLINLRCICGKTTDWYSNFGYDNGIRNVKRIGDEMQRIHDIKIQNSN